MNSIPRQNYAPASERIAESMLFAAAHRDGR